jgi:hypothetical protein
LRSAGRGGWVGWLVGLVIGWVGGRGVGAAPTPSMYMDVIETT